MHGRAWTERRGRPWKSVGVVPTVSAREEAGMLRNAGARAAREMSREERGAHRNIPSGLFVTDKIRVTGSEGASSLSARLSRHTSALVSERGWCETRGGRAPCPAAPQVPPPRQGCAGGERAWHRSHRKRCCSFSPRPPPTARSRALPPPSTYRARGVPCLRCASWRTAQKQGRPRATTRVRRRVLWEERLCAWRCGVEIKGYGSRMRMKSCSRR